MYINKKSTRYVNVLKKFFYALDKEIQNLDPNQNNEQNYYL